MIKCNETHHMSSQCPADLLKITLYTTGIYLACLFIYNICCKLCVMFKHKPKQPTHQETIKHLTKNQETTQENEHTYEPPSYSQIII